MCKASSVSCCAALGGQPHLSGPPFASSAQSNGDDAHLLDSHETCVRNGTGYLELILPLVKCFFFLSDLPLCIRCHSVWCSPFPLYTARPPKVPKVNRDPIIHVTVCGYLMPPGCWPRRTDVWGEACRAVTEEPGADTGSLLGQCAPLHPGQPLPGKLRAAACDLSVLVFFFFFFFFFWGLCFIFGFWFFFFAA